MSDPSVWLPLARKEHAAGRLRKFPEARCRVARLLKDLWPAFAEENGLPQDCQQSPPQTLAPVQFVQSQPIPVAQTVSGYGPGTQLKALLASLGVHAVPNCGCADYVALMNAWGVQGTTANKHTVVQWLKAGLNNYDWGTILATAPKAVMAARIVPNPLRPLESVLVALVDIAVEQARSAQQPEPLEGPTSVTP
jgi:hypothetical protein